MWMVYPSGVGFCKDNVLKLSPRKLSRSLLGPVHLYLGGSLGFLCILFTRTTTFPSQMGSTNYGQHLSYLIWTPLTRLLFFTYCLGLIYELLEVSCPREPFYIISWGHIPFGIVPYVLVEGAILLNIPLRPIAIMTSSCLYRLLSVTA